MQAIVLVGGMGTRLRSVIADVPKPMAPIHDKPFLAHLLYYLKKQGITSVVFPVHYMGEKIRAYFSANYAGIDIQYVEEETPLGTGGAIVNSLTAIPDLHSPVFVLNGDTFLKLDYQAMYQAQQKQNTALTIALRQVNDCSRYGKVVVDDQHIVEFREKGEVGAGLINAGVYLVRPSLFADYRLPQRFSFETDFLLPFLPDLNPHAFITNDYFIDIGIPDDYAKAINDLPALVI